MIITKNGIIHDINNQLCLIFGYQKEEIINKVKIMQIISNNKL